MINKSTPKSGVKRREYHRLYESGELHKKVLLAYEILKECRLCPRQCRVNRLENQKGFCKAGENPVISSAHPHFGEEPPLVGKYGSGTIFMTYCNLGCLYCQNYEISHLGIGKKISVEDFAQTMLTLQRQGCHNINLVTPTHFVPPILAALELAIPAGLFIPLVYNCGGYESLESLKLLEGVVDIYMPDAKYGSSEVAQKYSSAPDYPAVMEMALKEMHRQVGDLITDEEGIAQRGLLVRHLVLPEGLAGTEKVMPFIARELSPHTYVNIMDQYYPCYRAIEFPEINRRITLKEYQVAVAIARKYGLYRGF